MKRARQLVPALLLLAGCALLCADAGAQAAQAGSAQSPGAPVTLDRVVAILNGDVLLESDVQEEMQFAKLEPVAVPSGSDTPARAARRLINRTLILQQIKEQRLAAADIPDSDVTKQLAEIRKNLPACRPEDCTTEAGWNAFLTALNLTPQDVTEHWRQRLQILKFIDIRFRAGIRISRQEVADYYQKSILPAYKDAKDKPPSVDALAPRIQEVLLQQHVNGLLRDWLKTLRQEGSVQILDPAYGQSSGNAQDEDD